MKKLFMTILAILTIATGIMQASRRHGGHHRGHHGGRGFHRGGWGRRGYWGGGFGIGFGRPYWRRPYWRRPYLGYRGYWDSPSYDSNVVYVQQSDLQQLKTRIQGLEAEIAKLRQTRGAQQVVASLQGELKHHQARVDQLEGKKEQAQTPAQAKAAAPAA